jgi:TonB family protein
VKEDNAGLVIGLAAMLLGIVLIGAPLLLGHPPLQTSQPKTMGFGDGLSSARMTPNTLASSNLGNAASHMAGGGQASAELVTANNTAVGLISKGKNEDAIELLEPLLKGNPGYGLARDNLAIAYNNQALKQTDNPKVALDSLWRSFCLSASEAKTAENIDDMLKVLNKQPKRFEDRVAMGDAQVTEGCLYGAYAEYTAALAIHDDAALKHKLSEITKQAANCSDDDINGAFFVKMALLSRSRAKDFQPGNRTVGGRADPDYGSYMRTLQRSIKRNWFPPRKQSSKRTQVTFTVAKDGTLSNVRVTKSSGEADEDQAGLDAIKDLGKADPLPPGASPSVDIQFTFDYNVFDSSRGH